MKKRSSLFFTGLGCMALALGAATVVNADVASAGARIDYGTTSTWDNGCGPIEQSETNPVSWSCDEYFQVVASTGSILTYTQGKNTIATEADKTEGGNDVYYFKFPKKGEMTFEVTPKDGGDATKLTVTVNQAKKNAAVVKNITCKATYETTAEGYEYGNITGETEGVSDGAIQMFVPCSNGKSSTMSYYRISKDSIKTDADISAVNAFIKPLLREGATVTVVPYSTDSENKGKAYTEKHTYYVYENKDGKLTVTKTTDTLKIKYKASKVKIAKLKNPPKVKVDAVKGTVNLSDKMEYRFASYTNGTSVGNYDAWKAGEKKMALTKVSESSITAGGILQVRTKATGNKLYSKTASVKIPSQTSIDTTKITGSGTTTNGSIKITDFNKDTKPYEYTTSAPTDSTKWTAIKDGEIKFTAKNEAKGDIYIREKGINENTKKNIALKVPSTVAKVTISGSSLATDNLKISN